MITKDQSDKVAQILNTQMYLTEIFGNLEMIYPDELYSQVFILMNSHEFGLIIVWETNICNNEMSIRVYTKLSIIRRMLYM